MASSRNLNGVQKDFSKEVKLALNRRGWQAVWELRNCLVLSLAKGPLLRAETTLEGEL